MSNARRVVLGMLLGMPAFGQPPHPLFKIQGKVEGYLPTKAVNFYLLRGAGRTDPSRTLFDVHTGTFEIVDVVPESIGCELHRRR